MSTAATIGQKSRNALLESLNTVEEARKTYGIA
jgi:hypothetical protein